MWVFSHGCLSANLFHLNIATSSGLIFDTEVGVLEHGVFDFFMSSCSCEDLLDGLSTALIDFHLGCVLGRTIEILVEGRRLEND
jgi:hypothetical protein